jgi:uncharacterized membrane protein YdjX (TVP38/TMEM64 family)
MGRDSDTNQNSLVKSKTVSAVLRACLGLLIAALVSLAYYVYHDGGWREIVLYYRYFLNPRVLQAFVLSFGPYAAVIFVTLQGLQVVFAPIPGEVTGFVGGLLFGRIGGTILSTIGLTLGSALAFAIARWLGASFVHKIVKKEYIDRFDYFITHKGLYITYVLFLIPGFPKDSLCYLLGLTKMRWVDFILMNVFCRLPGTLILTLEGDAVRHGQYKAFWVLLALSAVLIAVLYFGREAIIRLSSRSKKLLQRKEKNEDGKTDPVNSEHVK